jgi:quercetin dioxygenase-like cupin family protein
MTESSKDHQAGLLALGALASAEWDAATRLAESDPDMETARCQWEAMLAGLTAALPLTPPPADLFDRIEARIDRLVKGETIRRDHGGWKEVMPGIRVKILHSDRDARRQTLMLDVQADAIYPPHRHEQVEEIYMISGDLRIGDVVLGPGDYHVSPAGSSHPGATSRGGCRCLIIQAMA